MSPPSNEPRRGPASGGPRSLPARALLYAHGFMAAVSVLVLVAFLPALGAPRVPVLYSLMYGTIRWQLFQIELFGVPLLFAVMVFALTGSARWAVRDALGTSDGYKRLVVWSWIVMLTAWFLALAIVAGGMA